MLAGPLQTAASPHEHVVGFYEADDDLVSDLARFVAVGLAVDEAVVVVATEAHRVALEARLDWSGIDTHHARSTERYWCVDAADTLSSFMMDGQPQWEPFLAVIGGLLDHATSRGASVRAFGEMVALLWDDGNLSAALGVEALWNALAQRRDFSLHCAYSLGSVANRDDLVAAGQICKQHSQVIPPAGYATKALPPVTFDLADERSQLFIPAPSAVPAVRRFVSQTLSAWGEDALVDDASLIVSELATNALRHANSPFRACVSRSPTSVRITIHDVSRAHPERQQPQASAATGRGISIVAGLSARWGTETAPDGKVVWSELDGSRRRR